jgi:hypothetical protein
MALKKVFKYFRRIKRTRKLLKREITNSTVKPLGIIYFYSIRAMPKHFIMEINLILLLIKSGYNIEIIMDDGIFEHTDTECISKQSLIYYRTRFKILKYRRRIEYFIWNISVGLFTPRLKILRASKVSGNLELIEKQPFNIKRQDFVKSSMIRFFNNETWPDSRLARWYHEITSKNVLIAESIGLHIQTKLANSGSNLFITSHGIYSTYGPAYNEIKNPRQRIVYGPNIYCIGAIQLFNNTQQFSFEEDSLVKFLSTDLTADQILQVDQFLDDRFSHKSKDTAVYFDNNGLSESFQLKDRDKLPGKVFAAFPNVIWDGNISERDTIFKSIRDWIITLIEYFKSNQQNSLVIRFHPAESTWMKGTITFESTLKETLRNIEEFKNIIIISSNKNFESYRLLNKYADYALVYDGILALEAPFFNVPVIFSGSGRFNVPNFGMQFKSVEDYMSFIALPTEYNMLEKDKLISKQLIYYYVIYNSYFFPVLDNKYDDNSFDENIFLKNPHMIEDSRVEIIKGLRRCI